MDEDLIRKTLRAKELIEELDLLDIGESLFVENDEVKNVRSLYLAMYRKGKKFLQIKQAIGYSLTRRS